ncbi:Lcl C-terminal domain-containing protein [Hydrogenimonas sp.]
MIKKTAVILTVLSLGLWGDMVRSDIGVVTDSATGLMWQDDYSDNGGAVKLATWIEAIDYCENLTLGGYSDWRLPNIRELNSIVDLSRYRPPIDPVFQITESSRRYWSSTAETGRTSDAWYVSFSSCSRGNYDKTLVYSVRCVRSGE